VWVLVRVHVAVCSERVVGRYIVWIDLSSRAPSLCSKVFDI
jgi:hypothetical protein